MKSRTSEIILWKVFLLTAFVHGVGVFLIHIRKDLTVPWSVSRVFFIEDIVVSKNPLPYHLTKATDNPLPALGELPELHFLSQEPSESGKNLKGEISDETMFGKSEKILADEEDYMTKELDPDVYLPLKESQADFNMFLARKSGVKRLKSASGFYVIYSGFNKPSVAQKFESLKEKFLSRGLKPPEELQIILTFSSENELLSCQIDKSSGMAAFDEEALRLLKTLIRPLNQTQVKYRGRLIVGFSGGKND